MAAEGYAPLSGRVALRQRDDRARRHQRAERRVRRLHDSIADGRRLRPGEARDDRARTARCRCASSATRRRTSSPWCTRHHQICRARERPGRHPLPVREGRLDWRPTAGRARSGSTSRSTCRAPLVDPATLARVRPGVEGADGRVGAERGGRAARRRRSAARRVRGRGAARDGPSVPSSCPASGVRLAGAFALFRRLVERTGPAGRARLQRARPRRRRPSAASRAGRAPSATGPATSPSRTPICVLVLGCRLNIRQISYNWASFARHAPGRDGRYRQGGARQADALDRPSRPRRSRAPSSRRCWRRCRRARRPPRTRRTGPGAATGRSATPPPCRPISSSARPSTPTPSRPS